MNKYDQIKLNQLIPWIQSTYLELTHLKSQKRSLSTFNRRVVDLNEMRTSAIERLQKTDRSSVDFFPVKSLVEYVHPNYSQKQKFGIVVDHADGYCLCQFTGEDFQVKVHPEHLKLRFIRSHYPF